MSPGNFPRIVELMEERADLIRTIDNLSVQLRSITDKVNDCTSSFYLTLNSSSGSFHITSALFIFEQAHNYQIFLKRTKDLLMQHLEVLDDEIETL